MAPGAIHLPLTKEDKSSLLPSAAPAAVPRSSPTSAPGVLARVLIGTLAVASLFYQLAPTVYYSASHSVAEGSWKDARAVGGYARWVMGAAERAQDGLLPIWSAKQAEDKFLAVPEAESARAASHSFTDTDHVAGSKGDREDALLVKTQWEELLGLPVTTNKENVFEAGSAESREWLTRDTQHPDNKHGKKGKKHHKHGRREKRGEKRHARKQRSLAKRLARKAKRAFKRACGGLARLRGQDSSSEAAVLPSFPGFGSKPRVWVDTYYPLLNYPVSHSLTMTPPGAKKPSFVAKLLEDEIKEDKTTKDGRFDVPTFHGLSKNGTATGQLVYAGRGTKQEFESLVAQGIDFTGKIAIVQYSGSFRGLKIDAATAAGAVGVLIYTDPKEDGEMTSEAGYEVYPYGPARQPSSVQRGSVQFLSLYPGDPLTPHEPAYKDTDARLPRDDPAINIPRIPSIPISYEDALPLLKSLNGKGIKLGGKKDDGSKEGGLEYLGVEYWTGPGEETIELVNVMDDKVTKIWNTYAVIPGLIPDEVVVLGNHNDAWTFGAGDPNSGTAAVHEVVKGFGELLKTGWKPLRTILVASWDAEEYGLIGSTEFGEDFPEWLKENVVAYINVDVATAGSLYSIGASPSLASLFTQISAEIEDPEQPGRSLFQRMVDQGPDGDDGAAELMAMSLSANSAHEASTDLQYVGPLGSGSDFTVFLQYLGLASANVGYGRKPTDPVYHYHSIYDSAYWMDTYGDPTFGRHVAVAKVMGLATLRLANDLILPINVTAYANELAYYASKVHALTEDLNESEIEKLGLDRLDESISLVQTAAKALDVEATLVLEEVEHLHKRLPLSLPKLMEALKKVRSINKRLQGFEGGFIDEAGLPMRTWYRNLVVAPGRYLGYGATTLPGLTESLTLDHNAAQAAVEVKRLVKAFDKVAKSLLA